MDKPVQIVFQGLTPSAEVTALCEAEAAKLERFGRVVSCQVAVSEPHRHHVEGNLFHVRVELHLPGGAVVVNRVPDEHRADEHLVQAVQEAFHKARRQVQDHVRRQRGFVKHHDERRPATRGGPAE